MSSPHHPPKRPGNSGPLLPSSRLTHGSRTYRTKVLLTSEDIRRALARIAHEILERTLGDQFKHTIVDEIDEPPIFIVLMAQDAEESRFVAFEVNAAMASLGKGKAIIPVQVRPCGHAIRALHGFQWVCLMPLAGTKNY